MTSSPTREEVERVSETLLGWLTGPDSGQNDGIMDAVSLLRALHARAEAAEILHAAVLHKMAAEVRLNLALGAERDAARAEAALLSAIENRCWDVRCVDVPTGGGDSDVAWVVIKHHMAPPRERQVGYGNSPAAAIRAALAGEAGRG